MNVPFTPVSEFNRVFESPEQRYNDEVFRSNRINNSFNDDNIVRNQHYGNPDYTKHVFTNMGNNLFMIDERNIALPIRNYSDITSFGIKYNTKDDVDKSSGLGVYIIERYTILDVTGVNIHSLMKYYRRAADLTEHTIKEIESKIATCSLNNSITVRIVTYIPKYDIDHYKYLFVSNNNVAIVKGMPTDIVKHPNSLTETDKLKRYRILNDDHPNTVSIDIVDNDNPYRPYYMQLGNKVQRFLSNPSNTKANGVTYIIKKDNELLADRTEFELSELDNIGIYKTEELARFNGDKKLILEDVNKELLYRKLDIEDNKVELSKQQLSNETVKRKHESKMEELKYVTAVDLAKIERETKLIGYKASLLKIKSDTLSNTINVIRDEQIHRHKVNAERIKTTTNAIGLLGGIIKFLPTIYK